MPSRATLTSVQSLTAMCKACLQRCMSSARACRLLSRCGLHSAGLPIYVYYCWARCKRCVAANTRCRDVSPRQAKIGNNSLLPPLSCLFTHARHDLPNKRRRLRVKRAAEKRNRLRHSQSDNLPASLKLLTFCLVKVFPPACSCRSSSLTSTTYRATVYSNQHVRR